EALGGDKALIDLGLPVTGKVASRKIDIIAARVYSEGQAAAEAVASPSSAEAFDRTAKAIDPVIHALRNAASKRTLWKALDWLRDQFDLEQRILRDRVESGIAQARSHDAVNAETLRKIYALEQQANAELAREEAITAKIPVRLKDVGRDLATRPDPDL